MITLILSFLILFGYIAMYLIVVGLLPSHSNSYYALMPKWKWLFPVTLATSSFLLLITALDYTPESLKFTAFLTCAPVLFTAFAPDFRKENGKVTMEGKVHMMGAKIGGYTFICLGGVDGLLVHMVAATGGWRVRNYILYAK